MIWCVDDDSTIRDIEVYALESTGFKARGFADGQSMLEALEQELPELIVLDIMLPGDDGIELLKKLRSEPRTHNIPVIMATAKGTEMDKIQGLNFGADDYLAKPFGVMEMIARIKAVLRRCDSSNNEEQELTVGEISLSEKKRTVEVQGNSIALTYKEFEILRMFMRNPGMVFSRDKLLMEIWGTDYVGESRTVDVHIKTLRQKLGDSGKMIETVIGVGYRLGGAK